jgi:xanthine dehydrogenase accessory factor
LNDNVDFIDTICGLLGEGKPLVLASIVSRQGSAPRHIGTKIVISADGGSYGTIGGGMMEAKVVMEARAVHGSGKSRLIHFDLDNQDVNTFEMICGGKATVMLEYLGVTQDNIEFFRCLQDAMAKGADGVLITLFTDNDPTQADVSHCLLFGDGRVAEQRHLEAEDMEILRAGVNATRSATTVRLKDRQALLEPLSRTKTLYCFGAGHVAVPTARIAALAGFRVIVVDDRAELASVERFPYATIHVVTDFDCALDGLNVDADSYIVIFTREHRYDRIVLEKALKTDAGYIGMIASRKKRDAIYEALLTEGVKRKDLERVHSPIGLDIGAETPEEIAVSIAAELIQERAKKRR